MKIKINMVLPLYSFYGFAGNDGEPAPQATDDVDWGTLFDDEDKEPKEEITDELPAEDIIPPVVEEVVPEVVPEVPALEPEPAVVPPVAAPTQPVEQPKALSQEELQAQQDKYLSELEKEFEISKEDSDLLVTNPEKVLPKIAVNLYKRVMMDVAQAMAHMQHQLPAVVEQTSKTVKQKEDASVAFKARWPGLLDSAEGQQAAVTAAQLYRQQKPNATMQEVIDNSGRIAYSILGKDVPAKTPAQAAPAASKPKPHTPASSKTAGVQTKQMTEEEAFYASFDLSKL